MKINVYGIGINAVKFVLEHKDVEINAFIEGRSKKDVFMKELFFEPKPILKLEEAETCMRQYYTVVASSPETYIEIRNNLEKKCGLTEFDDFCYCSIFRKKIAVVYGNCHTLPIKDGLQLSTDFSSKYGFYPLPAICNMKKRGEDELNWNVYERCDLFIHQCIRENNIYGSEFASSAIIKKLKSSCKVIGIPNVYRMPRFLYPQMKSYEEQILWENYNFFPFRDYYLDKFYGQMSVKELTEIVNDDSLIPVSFIMEERDRFFEKIEIREKQWDISVSNFIYKNLREEQLFYDPNHPCTSFFAYVCREILWQLNCKEVNDFASIRKLDHYELPIYASVKKALGIKYNITVLRRENMHYLNNAQMDLEEYIRQYLEWNHAIKRS